MSISITPNADGSLSISCGTESVTYHPHVATNDAVQPIQISDNSGVGLPLITISPNTTTAVLGVYRPPGDPRRGPTDPSALPTVGNLVMLTDQLKSIGPASPARRAFRWTGAEEVALANLRSAVAAAGCSYDLDIVFPRR